MPARCATFSSVVRSCPRSRTRARAASSSAARVRSRLSPFGFPLAIYNKIVHLFYNLNMNMNEAIENALLRDVEAGRFAGAAALVWRHGAIRHHVSVGRRDLVSGAPVERDTMFRIAS